MKTLANQTLIYDEDCPLCRVYTAGFVKAGMLDANGKKPFSQMQSCPYIDVSRAANEIALVDTKNGKAIYGIDSLLAVLGNSFPWIAKISKFAPVHFGLRKVYSFISYNRKVIMPNPKNTTKHVECLPDFNFKYRIAYLIFATFLTAITLHAYAAFLPKIAGNNLATELVLASAQIVFQAIFLFKYDVRTIVNYAGNLMTVSLFGAILLTPMLIAGEFFHINEFVGTNYFLLVATIMFIEHFRRVELLGLPKILCATWILYRLLFLFFLF
ncbi:MAG: hypothetical protein EOO50_15565 [Flavobacterium sp.]|uniref:hypothetical protein n=1 Tax=Flavobacterium sp. TaxID=239 RepID=UPI00122766DD|nr:hypothetical protein [Flavobacterium sp.]RZJ64442.1 MAG: hypothetical protein EOO50_15565 [Flavobacterium sp.]